MTDSSVDLSTALTRICTRAGLGEPTSLERLTGGANMESWRFEAGSELFVLRRAPSAEMMEGRPFLHDTEAAIIRAAKAAGVTAPEVVVELEPADGIGTGFVMRALTGTANPKEILLFDEAGALLTEAARDLARIHRLKRVDLPEAVPLMDYREAIANLREQFEEAGADRPIIALGLKWLEDNCPEEIDPVLVHGDYRLGNLLAEAPGRLTGVLDWELAHFGDRHEDLAFGCMAVWRFARYDRPALGLGSLEDYFAAYEAESGFAIDRARFRYWTIYRTVWWALGCLRSAKAWRDGADRMLERVVISRRTSEQELDLLMLLEEEAPDEERGKKLQPFDGYPEGKGEADAHELAIAISEWLETLKGSVSGHDRFQLAVARNALGIIGRNDRGGTWPSAFNSKHTRREFEDGLDLSSEHHLMMARSYALEKVAIDSPKYPALAIARKKWIGED